MATRDDFNVPHGSECACNTCLDLYSYVPIQYKETRITDPKTGGEKGQKDARLGSIDPSCLMDLGRVAGFGEAKYARLNYAKGYAWSLSYDALQRHLHAFWGGENLDPESGLPHLAHAAWHCFTLLFFVKRSLGTDDRYK